MERAIFLDRDGTLVHTRHYPTRPADLRLYAGIGPELRRLQYAGFRIIVITNQSGLARGYFGPADLDRMHEHLARELAQLDVRLDGIYHCPHHPAGSIPALAIECECRKPRPGMLLRAAADHGLDLGRSWLVGDILDDVAAGKRAGCRTVLVDLGTESPTADPMRQPDFIAQDTPHALQIVGSIEGLRPPVDLGYLPPAWRTSDQETRRLGDRDHLPFSLSPGLLVGEREREI